MRFASERLALRFVQIFSLVATTPVRLSCSVENIISFEMPLPAEGIGQNAASWSRVKANEEVFDRLASILA